MAPARPPVGENYHFWSSKTSSHGMQQSSHLHYYERSVIEAARVSWHRLAGIPLERGMAQGFVGHSGVCSPGQAEVPGGTGGGTFPNDVHIARGRARAGEKPFVVVVHNLNPERVGHRAGVAPLPQFYHESRTVCVTSAASRQCPNLGGSRCGGITCGGCIPGLAMSPSLGFTPRRHTGELYVVAVGQDPLWTGEGPDSVPDGGGCGAGMPSERRLSQKAIYGGCRRGPHKAVQNVQEFRG